MTHEERKERRKNIARDIANGVAVSDVSKNYGVGVATIINACQEHKTRIKIASVRIRSLPEIAPSTLVIIAELLNTNKPQATIAREMKLSSARIEQILTRARKAGIKFPHRKFAHNKKEVPK